MTKSKFDIEYSKWIQQVDVEGEDAVWNKIQDELDFIETWDNISGKLDEIKPQKGKLVPMNYLKKIAAIAAILLLVFLPVRHFLRQVNQPTVISELAIEEDERKITTSNKPAPTTTIQEETEGEENTEVAQEVQPVAKGEYLEEPISSPTYNGSTTAIMEGKSTEGIVSPDKMLIFEGVQIQLFKSDDLLAGSDDLFVPDLFDTEYQFIPEPDISSNLSLSKSFLKIVDVGLVYGYKNTWLINYETRNSLNPSKLGNIQPTFRQDIGISSTLELNKRHQFGLEFYWKSESGQNYQQYLNASFVNKNINLDYLKLQAYYCLENRRFPGQIILGGYVAGLTMAEEQIAGTTLSVNDFYNDLDYGLLAGYQANIPVTKNIIFKPGIRLNYNLVNIFKGDNIIPGNFKDTRNHAASFNLSFSYRFN